MYLQWLSSSIVTVSQGFTLQRNNLMLTMNINQLFVWPLTCLHLYAPTVSSPLLIFRTFILFSALHLFINLSTIVQVSHFPPSWFTLPSFSPPCLPFSKSAHVCQSHFKSVSCFNLLNLFFPQPLHLVSSPTPSYTLLSFCRHPHGSRNGTNHVILYFVLSAISLSFDVSIPASLLSCRLISLCFLSVASASQKKDHFSLVIFRGASKRRRRAG